MSAEDNFAKLGLELPPAPKPMGLYKPAVIAGNMLYLSGHGPLKPDGSLIVGRLGADFDVDAGAAAAQQTGLAMLAPSRPPLAVWIGSSVLSSSWAWCKVQTTLVSNQQSSTAAASFLAMSGVKKMGSAPEARSAPMHCPVRSRSRLKESLSSNRTG